ncbi:CNNM domain-containing protein [Pseudobacteriovorax antillogorgiicola]|uniref:Hemolysin, contains CBS domains n=1 Tax=Pseudobacteriovorax antillogorgiicola TaxID=1513793 RepID=A0A1Y6BHI6_9BACT|nr:hemolysin family protein [Pseudobacteriovorax antillogorgiicola]TCS55509.1 CBS domain containing-hemolysin-like protein [Pseudobacteriovorax antillogorgiicola]SMF11502.1 Hemolysin, contains CBS domains [Pseudobacteriovorax antillogorgiicola]
MILLISYVTLALGCSFLCSIAEAVILSVTPSYISLQEQEGRKKSARLLKKLKDDMNSSLAAILTLNTIAHTVGAAGAGAEAAAIFGDKYVGIISGVLTFLILVFSEIIPKTIGAHYWRGLAPSIAVFLKYLIIFFYPFVRLSAMLTRHLAHGPSLKGFNRDEFEAMAQLSFAEGQIAHQEQNIMKNLLQFHKNRVSQVLTPRTVVFSVCSDMSIGEFFDKHGNESFSRIPIYNTDREHIIGFVLRTDLLLAQARDEDDKPLKKFKREIHAIPETLSLSSTFELFISRRDQIMLVIDEHGGFEGIITLEDVIEFLIGHEIVDEGDKAPNMRRLARRLWASRQRQIPKG